MGYRGFAYKQTLNLAIPNGKPGSGLTILIGPNGGGKSTLVECFQKVSLANRSVSFSRGKRNLKAGDLVEIEIQLQDGSRGVLRTIRGGSQTQWEGIVSPKIYYLPSRRFFNPYFGMNQWDRETYLRNQYPQQQRSTSLDQYTSRLIHLNMNGSIRFDEMLCRIIGKPIEWAIDLNDTGQYFVKISKQGKQFHDSDGLGEGVLSLMFIVDALCGSDDEIIVIDEPELSLHPQLQNRLLKEILEKSRNSQIVISTHSPNMVSLEAIANGAMVARVFESEEDGGARINMIDEESREFIRSTLNNINNPHVLGLDARSCFFANDGIIITEGQEDVVLYPIILSGLYKNYDIPFFGFGAGGASSIRHVAHLLYTLGFERIGAIYDGDKKAECEDFNKTFSKNGYKAWVIPANDIREKPARKEEPSIEGLLQSDRKTLNPQYRSDVSNMFDEIKCFLES